MKKESWRTRRSRDTLVLAACLLVLSQVLLDVVIDVWWPLLRFPTARQMFHGVAQRSTSPDILFLGSSRSQGDFQEVEIGSLLEWAGGLDHRVSVLNASVPAGDHLAQNYLLEELLQTGIHPRLVVLEVSPEFLNRSNPFYQYTILRHLRWSDIPSHLSTLLNPNHLTKLAGARFLPAYQHRQQFLELAGDLISGTSAKPLAPPRLNFAPPEGCTPRQDSVPWDDLLAVKEPALTLPVQAEMFAGAERVRKKWLRDYEIVDVAINALVNSEERARLAGADVLLFTPPVSSAHRAAISPEIEEAYQAVLTDLAARTGCRYVDCRDWLPDGFFYDHHHVLPEGGKLFSRQFTREVLLPWLRPQIEKR